MELVLEFMLTIFVSLLLPFLLSFVLPLLLSSSRDVKGHVGKKSVLYKHNSQAELEVLDWQSEIRSGFVEKVVEVDEFVCEPIEGSFVVQDFVGESCGSPNIHEGSETDENEVSTEVGVVNLQERRVEEESSSGYGGIWGCQENVVDGSSERHEYCEVCMPEKCVDEESSSGHGGIWGCVENVVDGSSERHEYDEIVVDLEENEVGISESKEIKESECDGNDETDGAKENVVDGVEKVGFLGEEDDWEGIERTELERLFGAAVVFVGSKSNADRVSSLGSDVKMRLDGLHKIATRGPCLEPQPMAFKVSARAKWNAWQQLGNMSAEVAMEQYITLLSESVPGWIQDVHGNFSDAQVFEKVASDVKTLVQNNTEFSGERCSIFPSLLTNVNHFQKSSTKACVKGLVEIGVLTH